MSIKYINRKANLDLLSPTPCAQLVNVPQLQGCTRCFFCRHYQNWNNDSEYSKCARQHKCGWESLLYAYLNNSGSLGNPPVAAHFSPSQVIKSLSIDNMTRYIQLWSCDLDGYECCRLCQFYAARVEADQSISECSNTHVCGRNGSWWDLLTLRDSDLLYLPDIFDTQLSDNQFYTLDGVIHNASFTRFILDPFGYIVVLMSDGEVYFPMLMKKSFCMSWNILTGTNDDARTWSFSRLYNKVTFSPQRTMLLSFPNNPVWRALVDNMFSEEQFLERNRSWWLTTGSNSQRALFTYCESSFDEVVVGSHILVTIEDVANKYDYTICNRGTLKFLSLPYSGAPINKAKWVTLTADQANSLTYVTSRTMNTPSVNFLTIMGVRESIFY